MNGFCLTVLHYPRNTPTLWDLGELDKQFGHSQPCKWQLCYFTQYLDIFHLTVLVVHFTLTFQFAPQNFGSYLGRLFLSTASLADDARFWVASRSDQLTLKWYDVVFYIVAKPIFGQYFIPLTIHAISREQ